MASKEIAHSGFCIYYEDRNVYLGKDGIQYEKPCNECLYGPGNGYFKPELLAEAVAYNRKVFNGNIYVVRVEIKCKKANRHNEDVFDYDRFVKYHNDRTQQSIEETLKEIKARIRDFTLNKYEHKSMLTWIKHCKRYLQETFYNKPKKEVNDGRE